MSESGDLHKNPKHDAFKYQVAGLSSLGSFMIGRSVQIELAIVSQEDS